MPLGQTRFVAGSDKTLAWRFDDIAGAVIATAGTGCACFHVSARSLCDWILSAQVRFLRASDEHLTRQFSAGGVLSPLLEIDFR
jgi:hypothetical protein